MKCVLQKGVVGGENTVTLTLMDNKDEPHGYVDVSTIISVESFKISSETEIETIATVLGDYIVEDDVAKQEEIKEELQARLQAKSAKNTISALDNLDSLGYFYKQKSTRAEFLQQAKQAKQAERDEFLIPAKRAERAERAEFLIPAERLDDAITHIQKVIKKYRPFLNAHTDQLEAPHSELYENLRALLNILCNIREKKLDVNCTNTEKLNEVYKAIVPALEDGERSQWVALVGGVIATILVAVALMILLPPVALLSSAGVMAAAATAVAAGVGAYKFIDKPVNEKGFAAKIQEQINVLKDITTLSVNK